MSTLTLTKPLQLTTFIKKRALISYFILAFGISWVLWFIEPSLRARDALTANLLIQFGTFGPIFSAMIVSAIAHPERVHSPVWSRFVLGGIILALTIYCSWPSATYLLANGSNWVNWLLLGLLTVVPAWIFFNVKSGISGVQGLLSSLGGWRTRLLWVGTALFLMLVLSISGVLVTALITGQSLLSFYQAFLTSESLKNLPLVLLATAFYGGPLGEESGWRGFALPRLQKHFDPLLASVYLGLIWGFWHLPLHVTGYYDAAFGNAITGLVMRAFTTIPLTIIFTWLYNRSKGNLLVLVVLHTAVNVTSSLVAPGVGMYVTTTIAVVLIVVFDRMYRKSEKQVIK